LISKQTYFSNGNLIGRLFYGTTKGLVMEVAGAFLVPNFTILLELKLFAFVFIIPEKINKIFQFHRFFVLIFARFKSVV
jgi:hypothetical protein